MGGLLRSDATPPSNGVRRYERMVTTCIVSIRYQRASCAACAGSTRTEVCEITAALHINHCTSTANHDNSTQHTTGMLIIQLYANLFKCCQARVQTCRDSGADPDGGSGSGGSFYTSFYTK